MIKNICKPFGMCGSIKNLGCDHQNVGCKGVMEDKGIIRTEAQPETVHEKHGQDAGSSMERVPKNNVATTEATLTESTVLDDNPMWQMIARRCPDEW